MFDISEWAHSIPEAAELIAVDMWYSGEISRYFDFSGPFSDEIDLDEDSEEFDPRIISFLQDPIMQIQCILCAAIDRGELKTLRVLRKFSSNSICPEATFLSHIALVEWLERRAPIGEVFEGYEEDVVDILMYINEEIEILKKARRDDRRVFRSILRRNSEDKNLSDSWKASQLKNKELSALVEYFQQGDLPHDKPEKPLTTRSRRTHQAIIAALCQKAGVDWAARGGAQKIIDALELMGIPADGNTIRRILKEIPDALEARQK